ncbi:MAG: hypothetical protein ABL967_08370 [Bryobacteraceae bacterium]
MLRTFVIGFCAVVLLGPSTIPAVADQWDKKTTVTFSKPVEFPNTVLPAGTYVFKLLDSAQNRHVVQVFNKEENHIYTTVLAIPNYRLKPTTETVMRFGEAIRDNPEPIRAWFYPADSFGQEFVYPKKRAMELAVTTHVPVLAAPVTPTEKPEEMMREPVVAVTPERKEVEVTEVTGKPEAPRMIAQAAPPPAMPAELPKTASPVPMLITIALSALGLAGVTRVYAKYIS